MAIAKVTEWHGAAVVNGVVTQVPRGFLRVQTVTFTTTTPTAAAIGGDCGLVDITVSADAYWAIGASPVADTNSMAIWGGERLVIAPPPSGSVKFAFVAV